MIETLTNSQHEFFRPLVTGWLGKIEAARTARKKWDEMAEECRMFYSRSAAAMWDDQYGRKFWRNVKAPKFRITINKAFEFVAIFGPNLMWDRPHRNVVPKRKEDYPPEIIEALGPEMQQVYQSLLGQQQQKNAIDKTVSYLMQCWLNYTPRELDLEGHSKLAVIDAMLFGRGCLCPRPYKFPTGNKMLTGCFHEPPQRIWIDPDARKLDEAKWLCIEHTEPHWVVEDRFGHPRGSLKERATLESSWSYGEYYGNDDKGNPHRAAGQTNDLVKWYEVFSKTGVGGRLTGMDEALKNTLEQTVGDYAYLAICASVPYPLNASTQKIRSGATSADVKQMFAWPIPLLWADNRWPVEFLDFYPDTDSPYPLPPLAAAMGELKLLNFLIPWLAQSVYTGSRRFWAVLGQHVEHYKQYLLDGEDQTIIGTPPGVGGDDIKKVITQINQAEINADIWRIVEIVSQLFDKRTGLTEFAYGRNEGGTQDRTAQTTMERKQAVGVRPEYMQKEVVSWQSRLARTEAIVARRFISGGDVAGLLGPLGKLLWEQHIMASDVELVLREMQYEIAASSIRRPNRDKDIQDFTIFQDKWIPLIQTRAVETGDWEQANGVLDKFGELHDMDMERMKFPAPTEEQAAAQQEQQQLAAAMQQAEVQKTQAEAAKLTAEAQANPAEIKLAELQMKMAETQMNIKAKFAELELKAKQGEQDMALEIAKARAELAMDAQKHQQDMAMKREEHTLDMSLERHRGAIQIATQKAQGEQQLKLTKKQSDAKVQAMKAQAKAKPKPKTNGKPAAA